jgi:hypothetical protein
MWKISATLLTMIFPDNAETYIHRIGGTARQLVKRELLYL